MIEHCVELLPSISRNCPIDLKEAISSVIIASPRCSDIPELMDVRKHITAKYGKEFISAAIELRPDCGVNRLLVEKLSTIAPDGPNKIRILTAIAEEHNVKWKPMSFAENDVKSSHDLRIGINTNEKASYVELPQAHAQPVPDVKEHPNLHASSQHKEVDDVSPKFYERNASFADKKVGGDKSTTSGRSNSEIGSSGAGSQEMDFGDSYSEKRITFRMGKHNFNMEFKDATSVAQAAAESAKRSSMAARAAAHLSNRENITRQHSNESQSSFTSGLRDEVPQEYAFHDDKNLSTERASVATRAATELSNHQNKSRQYSTGSQSSSGSSLRDGLPQAYAFRDGKHVSAESVNNIIRSSNYGMQNEQINAREQGNLVGAPDQNCRNSHENAMKHARSASLTSSSSSGDDNPFSYGSQMAYTYPHNNSVEQENSDFIHQVSMKKRASRTKVDLLSELHGDMNTENNYYFRDARMSRQSSKASSYSQFITPSDDHNGILKLNSQKTGNNTAADLFVTDEANTQNNLKETSSYNDNAVIFDDYGLEDNDFKFIGDNKFVEQGSSFHFSSSESKSQIDPLMNRNAWIPGKVYDEKEGSSTSQCLCSLVSESLTKSAVSSGKEDLSVTFDDSDGPSSEDEDLIKPKVAASYSHGISVPIHSTNHGTLGSLSMNDATVDSDPKSWLLRSSVGSDTVDEHFERKIGIKSRASITYFNSDNSDSEDELPKQNSTNLVHRKSSAKVQHSSSFPKTVKPDSSQASESSNSRADTASKENASHVHPKLPDYDSFAAHFLSLKKGRQ